MFKRTKLCTHLLLAFGVLPVFAQDAPTQRVEITGSSIKRVDSETALPVTVISREQIEKSGAVTVQDLIHHVTASGAMFADSTQGAGYATANANLRGLGASSTLILLNGRRLANFAFGSVGGNVAVDLNSIPFAALDRIEVLRDGASAVYGSDAVGGVINFITRKNYKGGELSIRYGDTEAGIGGTESGGSIAFGLGDPGVDKYNLLVTANIQKQTRVKSVDQQWYMRGLKEIPGSSPPTSGRAFPGRFWDQFDTITPGAYVNDGTTNDPNLAGCDPTYTVVQNFTNDDGTPYLTPGGQQAKACRFIYAAALDNLPDSERGDLFARFSYNFSDDTEFYAEGSYARNHNIGRVAPVPISNDAGHIDAATGEYPHFAMPVTSPYFPRALLETLGYTVPDTGSVDVMMRAVPVGNRINDNTNEQTRFVTGLRGLAAGWDYDTGLTWAQSSGSLEYRGYINEPKFLAALATGNINPFGPMNDAGNALLRSTLMEGPMRESTSTVTVVDGKASRDLMKMDGGQMAIAIGGDIRREEADDKPVNDDYRQGLHIGGEGSVPATKASRTAYAAFTELVVPFVKGVEATVAARFDHYSDFGNTFNPRASIRWQPVKQVVLRASAGTGFRAPTLWDVNAPPAFTNTANSLNDPDCPLVTNPPQARCATQFTVRNSSDPNLKPEKSRQWAIGAVLDPLPWLSTTIDYWSISKKDQIGQVSGDSIMSDTGPGGLYEQYADRVHRGNDGYITFIDQPVENLGGLRTSGVDLSVRTRWGLGDLGKLALELDGTYLTEWEQQNGKGSPYVSYLGIDSGNVPPVSRWQHTLAADWQWGSFGVRLENVFVKGWTEQATAVANNVGVEVDHKVKDTNRFNLALTYTGFEHLTIRLGARNLFDADPPFTAVSSYGSHAAGFAGSFADPRGRIWYAAATYKF